jgi:hypothetical protein
MRKSHAGAVGILAAAVLTLPFAAVGAPLPAAGGDDGSLTPGQLDAVEAGFQVAPKSDDARRGDAAVTDPNPFMANLPDLTKADYATWIRRMAEEGRARAASPKLASLQRQATPGADTAPVVHDEEEPAGTAGSNDSVENAERVTTFGTAAAKNNRLRILGDFADLAPATDDLAAPTEDNGSITLATDSTIDGEGAVETDTELGDGPHGSGGDGSNDFDFYSVEVGAGRSLVASTEGTTSGVDTILAVYDADGELLAADDDGGAGVLSLLTFTPETAGTYYVLVGGFSFAGPLPADPFDSGSGSGLAEEGDYHLSIAAQQVDADYYSVRLRPGDVIGGVANGVANGLAITTPSGEERVSAVGLDASSLYPPTSPLPGGGNTTLAYVAEEAGWYAIQATGGTGAYDLTVEGYRPGTQGDSGRRQTVLLDFAPGRVNTGIWGGPGTRELSPFSAFIAKWGLSRTQERQIENKITNTVRANIQEEVEEAGLNDSVNVDVVTTRTNPELEGKPNVSHVYVAGTIAESGINTIGIAQYIDPGNYGHEDEAIILLDVLSNPAGPISSLNTFMNASSDRMKFVTNAVGNVVSHEIGHTIGNYHTDFSNDVHNIMDSGGGFFAENLYGVGPDMIGGTADDENTMFETDTYSPAEGFTGLENTLNVTAWGYAGK